MYMHPLRKARKTHKNRMLTQQELADLTGLSKSTIERAERGEPVSSYTCQQLSEFFDKTAQELGLISEEITIEQPKTQTLTSDSNSSVMQQGISAPAIHMRYQAVDTLYRSSEVSPEEQLGAWLALGVADLTPLFDAGWSLETLLESLQVVLKGVQAMPKFSRRRLLELGAASMMSGVKVPEGRHISAEERTQLCNALEETIIAGWRLFHTAGNAQVMAVGQAQLILLKQNHSILPSRNRSVLYTSVYNLIGKALHFQGYYHNALEAHTNAHVASMATGDPWHVTQSLICQADSHQALNQHIEAIETIEEALRIIGSPDEETFIRTKAHLLACWADNAMAIGENSIARQKLDAAEGLLVRISPNEEFDRANWLQLAGKYAFLNKDYSTAIRCYEEALTELPPHWLLRQAFVLIPMMVTYTCIGDRAASLATANKAVSVISALNAPSVNKQFAEGVQLGLLGAFPHDTQIESFAADLRYKLPMLEIASSTRY